MVVFSRGVRSDGFDMLKVPARCSRRLLLIAVGTAVCELKAVGMIV
jgi:hypothetical protein